MPRPPRGLRSFRGPRIRRSPVLKRIQRPRRKVHQDFPVVSQARLNLITEEKNLIPEGLAWDPNRKVFYLSSLAKKKIVQITPDSHVTDFVPADRDHLLPVLGIRLDPRDSTIWANTEDDLGKAELVHFDTSGHLLARFSLNDNTKHGFNDLVILKSGEIFLTDSLDNKVFRFNPADNSFSAGLKRKTLLSRLSVRKISPDLRMTRSLKPCFVLSLREKRARRCPEVSKWTSSALPRSSSVLAQMVESRGSRRMPRTGRRWSRSAGTKSVTWLSGVIWTIFFLARLLR